MTKEDFKKVNIGDTILFTPDFDNPGSFEMSNQHDKMLEKDIKSIELRFVENKLGFENFVSYEMRMINKNGEYVTDDEWLYDEDKRPEPSDDMPPETYVETATDTMFLGYLLKFSDWLKYI